MNEWSLAGWWKRMGNQEANLYGITWIFRRADHHCTTTFSIHLVNTRLVILHKKTAMMHDHLLFTCGKQEKQIVLEIKKGNTDRSVVPWEEGESLSPFLFLALFLPDLAISKRACLQASGESKIIFIISDSLNSLG